MKKSSQYYLCNDRCRFIIQHGVIQEAASVKDPLQVVYINPEKGFGNLHLAWSKNGEQHTCEPFLSEDFTDTAPEKVGRNLRYHGVASLKDLKVSVEYFLESAGLTQTVIVTNESNAAIQLLDLGLQFSCHTDFKWGENASKEVIGHYFVAGNGSRATYYRCDGAGDILTVIPAGGSEWLYYDACPANEQLADQGTTYLYALNQAASTKAAEAGTVFRIPPQGYTLNAGESYTYQGNIFFAADYDDCRDKLVERGQVTAESIPGYTVPKEAQVLLCLRSHAEELALTCPNAEITFQRQEDDRRYYQVRFTALGEQCITVSYAEEYVHLYYFVTEDVQTLLQKRGAFIADKQIRDESKWYNGLLAEYNNETGVVLSPDNYDKITGWRIYEVTCDDPGLSKPAFLSTKLAVYPVQEEVDALDYYIENFVWGGLQQTEDEPYPFGLYGIPDWHALRCSDKEGPEGHLHIWRIYDYPHIALMYYNMYVVAASYKGICTKLSAETYLMRAYGTALAMFRIPEEISGWSAYKTGLYNELIIPDIVAALRENDHNFEADRLWNHWMRKTTYFAVECKDVFGSEYPFDTTGFESTHVLAKTALRAASFGKNDSPFSEEIPYSKVMEFMENQTACNIACRGLLEPAYFWYGSDYRGNNSHYLLSYMSQMGGHSLLDYACYHAEDPFAVLRLAYGSLLSSWALLNTGDEESGYGYWFPGKEKDGCASGGFEPLNIGETWLNQPHAGGPWYYSCEIDLGFCGGVRGAATVLADDPMFGQVCYGGTVSRENDVLSVTCRDGVRKRFHYVGKNEKLHIELLCGRFADADSVSISKDGKEIVIRVENSDLAIPVKVKLMTENMGDYQIAGKDSVLKDYEETTLEIAGDKLVLSK